VALLSAAAAMLNFPSGAATPEPADEPRHDGFV
jgi:hypothetical protein